MVIVRRKKGGQKKKQTDLFERLSFLLLPLVCVCVWIEKMMFYCVHDVFFPMDVCLDGKATPTLLLHLLCFCNREAHTHTHTQVGRYTRKKIQYNIITIQPSPGWGGSHRRNLSEATTRTQHPHRHTTLIN